MTTETTPLSASIDRPPTTKGYAIICSKGSLDMAYPGLILANAARMAGLEAKIFFTFWGMDIINEKKIDHLHLSFVGNPSVPVPAMIAGLPGMEAMATHMMKKEMEKLDIPPLRELIEILDDSGAELYACQMAADMFHLEKSDLIPQVRDVISAMDFVEVADGLQVIFV